jgi:DNA polymerase-3 subunit gamma/tau
MASLDKKYRPSTFKNFVGNEVVVRRLKSLLKDLDSFPSCILLQGPSGCGKTTLARIVAKSLKIKEVHELNIAYQRKIDDARSIVDGIRYQSMETTSGKVIVLNECHKANNEFQNAILESLEEPPPHVHFILCTTEPNKLLDTIRTRADKFQVKRLGRTEISELVKNVSRKEDIAISKSIIRKIATGADGSPRVALVLLNSIKNIEGREEKLEVIKEMIESEIASEEAIELSRALLKGDSYKRIMKLVNKLEEDPEIIRREILKYMSTVLINGKNNKAALIINNFWDDYYSVGKAGLILNVYNTIEVQGE